MAGEYLEQLCHAKEHAEVLLELAGCADVVANRQGALPSWRDELRITEADLLLVGLRSRWNSVKLLHTPECARVADRQ